MKKSKYVKIGRKRLRLQPLKGLPEYLQRIRAVMREREISMQTIADEAQVHLSLVSRCLSGKRTFPVRVADLLERATGVEIPMEHMVQTQYQQVLDKLQKEGTCWLATHNTFQYARKIMMPVEDGEKRFNTCGNTLCVNPAHYEVRPKGFFTSKDPVAHFNSRVVRTSTCWIWCGNFNRQGMPMVQLTHTSYSARRVAMRIAERPVPDGKRLTTTCGRRECVNPDHITVYEGGKSDAASYSDGS